MLDNQDQQRQDALAREERQELREERLREEARVREQEARAREERQERREERLREEARSREERQLQDARADKERMERQAYAAAAALQQAATPNLDLAKLAFLNPSEPKPPGRTPETPAKASSPHRSERDGERSQAESPPPSSKGPISPPRQHRQCATARDPMTCSLSTPLGPSFHSLPRTAGRTTGR